jgi:uncharacterized protein
MAHGDIGHLEIPADDLDRARRFYEGVFGWELGEMEGFADYLLFRSPSETVVSGGAIGKRGETAGQGIRQYVSVDSIDETLRIAEELGGRVVTGRDEVPGQGWYAVIEDTEGNEMGLWEGASGSQ